MSGTGDWSDINHMNNWRKPDWGDLKTLQSVARYNECVASDCNPVNIILYASQNQSEIRFSAGYFLRRYKVEGEVFYCKPLKLPDKGTAQSSFIQKFSRKDENANFDAPFIEQEAKTSAEQEAFVTNFPSKDENTHFDKSFIEQNNAQKTFEADFSNKNKSAKLDATFIEQGAKASAEQGSFSANFSSKDENIRLDAPFIKQETKKDAMQKTFKANFCNKDENIKPNAPFIEQVPKENAEQGAFESTFQSEDKVGTNEQSAGGELFNEEGRSEDVKSALEGEDKLFCKNKLCGEDKLCDGDELCNSGTFGEVCENDLGGERKMQVDGGESKFQGGGIVQGGGEEARFDSAPSFQSAADILSVYKKCGEAVERLGLLTGREVHGLGSEWRINLEREKSDYVYLTAAIASLQGKRYQKKRGHINRFTALHPNWKSRKIDKTSAIDILKVADEWLGEQETVPPSLLTERAMIGELLRHFDEAGLFGVVIYDEGPCAFCLATQTCARAFDIHFEKAVGQAAIDGVYALVFNEAAKAFLQYRYANREEDLGLEGLRKSKLSWKPDLLLDKWKATYNR